ncbi:MAG: AAA family ATPase, partial [Muribaculaceae bacterium]|nr:AAA family ATPase [Muribaculaceae bacterium]
NRLAELRDLFYNHSKTGQFSFAPLRFPWLNPTQEHAVNEVLLAKDVAVVHGPPGTGKTTTLVEAIYETLRRENQVLVCAQSNMAVDWISERLMDRGVEVLRIGNPTKVNDKMLGFTYERRFEAHPDYPQLWAIRKAIRELRGAKRRSTDSYHQKLDRLRSRETELELRINNELFNSARVISCTLAGSASRVLQGMKFATLFIDEAAQALEAACWIAIAKAGRVVLAGDHCQLPPTIKCLDAIKGGLAKTLMERIVETNPQVVTLLKVQYRMNDDIMRFSSDWFYGGQVQSAPEVKYRSILDFDTPMTWVDTSQLDIESHEEMVGETYGRINRVEAQLTIDTLQQYFERLGRHHVIDERLDVGIISPYRAQVQYLRRLLRRSAYFKPLRHLITVNTVDGFQGQERDIIIISMVRQNEQGQIGFLRDLRRMNVAITRARMKLFIMGDSTTMTRHPFYRKLYQYIQQLGEL